MEHELIWLSMAAVYVVSSVVFHYRWETLNRKWSDRSFRQSAARARSDELSVQRTEACVAAYGPDMVSDLGAMDARRLRRELELEQGAGNTVKDIEQKLETLQGLIDKAK